MIESDMATVSVSFTSSWPNFGALGRNGVANITLISVIANAELVMITPSTAMSL